jgi:hypothetical protein
MPTSFRNFIHGKLIFHTSQAQFENFHQLIFRSFPKIKYMYTCFLENGDVSWRQKIHTIAYVEWHGRYEKLWLVAVIMAGEKQIPGIPTRERAIYWLKSWWRASIHICACEQDEIKKMAKLNRVSGPVFETASKEAGKFFFHALFWKK